MVATFEPPRPPKAVLDYLESKGLSPVWSWADVWREEHRAAFTVAGVMERDILEDIKVAAETALREGLPFQQFRKLITPILADKGWLIRRDVRDPLTGDTKDVNLGHAHRLETIYDTNLRSARAAGQWGRIEETRDAFPYLEYIHGPSRVPRPEHLANHGLILPQNHPFWRTHFPPNGFGCTCSTRQVAGPEARRRGISPDPDVTPVEWVHPRTGATVYVPKGVDPGFDYNVGIRRFEGLR